MTNETEAEVQDHLDRVWGFEAVAVPGMPMDEILVIPSEPRRQYESDEAYKTRLMAGSVRIIGIGAPR